MRIRTLALSALLFPTLGTGQVVEQWVHLYDDPLHDYDVPAAIAVDATGNVVVAGTSAGAGTGRDLCVTKYAAADGALLWEKRRSSPGVWNDGMVGMVVDGTGNVIVTGTLQFSNLDSDIITAKYAAADGALIWEQQHDGPADSAMSSDFAVAIAVDSSGDVVVTGAEVGIGTGDDWYTAKYAASNGAILWEQRYVAPSPFDTPSAIAIGGTGNVIVTGSAHNPSDFPPPADFYTVKYAAADGQQIWAVRHGGAASDLSQAVAIDPSGNAIITGSTGTDLYTAKYAATTGALMWEKTYNGPANGTDAAYAIAADASGNVFIAGESAGVGTGLDFYTAKYAAADGATLWEKRHNGSYSYPDYARGVKLDASGNPTVGGTTFVDGYDFYVAKYSTFDGSLLWDRRFSLSGFSGEQASQRGLFALTAAGGAVLTGFTSTSVSDDFDILTVKFTPASDADGDGLPDAWELSHWGTTVGHNAPDDSDSDGFNELAEYAFGLDPRSGDRSSAPMPLSEEGYLTLTLTRQPGVVFAVETSGDLLPASWSTASTTVLIDDAATLKVRDNVPVSAAQSRFIRVKISTP